MAEVNCEQLQWNPLSQERASSYIGEKVIAARGDAKLYTGLVVDVGRGEMTLASGNQRQILQFDNYRYMVATFDGPDSWVPRTAEKKLI